MSDSVIVLLLIGSFVGPLLLGVAVVTGLLALSPRVRTSGWLRVIWASAAGSTILTFLLLPVMYRDPYGIDSPTLGALYIVPFAAVDAMMLTIGDSDPVVLTWVIPVATWLQFVVLLFFIGAIVRALIRRRAAAGRVRLTSASAER